MPKKTIVLIVGLALAAGAYFAGTSALERRLRRAIQEAGVTVQDVSVRLAWASLLRGRPGVELSLTAPELSLRWSKGSLTGFSLKPLRSSRAGRVPVVQLHVEKGRISLLDQTVSPEVAWEVRDLALAARADWKSGPCVFEGTGALADGMAGGKGRLKLDGSAVLPRGPVDASVSLTHGRVGELAPYLRQVLGTAPSRGTVEVASRVTLHGGVLMSKNDVSASGVGFPTDEPTVLGPDGNRLVQLLRSPDGKVSLSFVMTGEVGKGLDWSDLAAGAMREAIQQAMARGIQRVLSDTEQQPVEEAVRKGLDSLGR